MAELTCAFRQPSTRFSGHLMSFVIFKYEVLIFIKCCFPTSWNLVLQMGTIFEGWTTNVFGHHIKNNISIG